MRNISQAAHEEIRKTALSVFRLSLDRAKHQCPRWAKSGKTKNKIIKVYYKSALKNYFRFAYGKDGERYHVDHIIPLHGEKVSGLHVPWNLHVIPATINTAKGTMVVQKYCDKPSRGVPKWLLTALGNWE